MIDVTRFCIVSVAETALKKLKKAQIGVYGCKKDGVNFIFSVKDKDIKKVFAIFDKPCYNTRVIKPSALKRFKSGIALRAGLIAGALIFIAAALISDGFMLKIEIGGSGSYLEPEVRRIILDEGAGEFKPYSALDIPAATGRILALPQVTFCNIEKRGSVLMIDVRTDGGQYGSVDVNPLVSDVDGVVKNITVICGTPAVSAGDAVRKGDVLIAAQTLAGDKTVDCIASGYAEIECSKTAEYFAEEESEESLKNAYSSLLLEEGRILSRKYKVKPTAGGVIYVIEFTYLHKLSINLS